MKKMYYRGTALLLILMAFLLAMNGLRRRDEALAAKLAPEVLRFHVLANSDSANDQTLKLAVKDYLLEEIRSGLVSITETESADKWNHIAKSAPISQTTTLLTKDMVTSYVLDNKSVLETKAESFVKSCGFGYPVEIRLETCEFPVRTYGDMTFPAGLYDAVRVLIGDGAGKNFWCVLYPSLCYLDSSYAIVPDESKSILQAVLPEDDFQALLSARRGARRASFGVSVSNGSEQMLCADTEKKEQDIFLPQITFRFKFVELFDSLIP